MNNAFAERFLWQITLLIYNGFINPLKINYHTGVVVKDLLTEPMHLLSACQITSILNTFFL